MTQERVARIEVSQVPDQELLAGLQRLVCADRTLTARLIVHIGEVDARGLYRERAYSSMFAYCVEGLHMSEAQAYLRIQAARLGRQFPLVVQLLAQGALHLTAIKLLGPHLTVDNHVQLLERARSKGKREIELLVATIAPKPDVPSRMRKLPETSSALATPPDSPLALTSVGSKQEPVALEADTTQVPSPPSEACDAIRQPSSDIRMATQALGTSAAPFALEPPRPRASSKPLSPGRYKLEFTAGQALHDKLVQLKELLRHQLPDGDLAAIVERAVDVLIDKTMKQTFAEMRAPKKPRSIKRVNLGRRFAAAVGQPPRALGSMPNSRYIPRAVVREVHARDARQCTFVSADGRRCSERGFLELHHHHVPFARGGKATLDNLRLVCRAHNALLAELDFGTAFMRSKLAQRRESIDKLGPERAQT